MKYLSDTPLHIFFKYIMYIFFLKIHVLNTWVIFPKCSTFLIAIIFWTRRTFFVHCINSFYNFTYIFSKQKGAPSHTERSRKYKLYDFVVAMVWVHIVVIDKIISILDIDKSSVPNYKVSTNPRDR